MADEENPFGGGPFGVGPFGPLVATVVAAAAVINAGASVTTGWAGGRTLHYQAKAFVAAPDEVLNPPVAGTESFTITTGQVTRKTLFYQAEIAPPLRPAEAEVVVVNIGWHAPFSTPPPRKLLVQRQQNQPFIPALAPPVTTAGWLQPFNRQVPGPFPVHTQPVLAYTAAPQPTPDEWLQPFQRAAPTPPVHHTQPVSGYQPEAVISNLTTTLEWLRPFQKAVPPPHPALSQPVFGYPYEAAVVSNLTTTLEWMPAWTGPPRYWPQKTNVTNVAVPSNLTATLEWLQPWQAAKPTRPVYTQPVHAQPTPNLTATLEWQVAWQKAVPAQPVRHTQPVFGYPYPTVENTIAGLGWIYRFEKAVPVPAVRHTQPVYAYPPAAVANTRTEWDWSIAWQGPPRTLQRLAAGPVYPLPPSNYRNEWDWPLAWNLAAKAPKPVHTQPVSGYPYATVENTITGIAWLYRFEKAVPAPPVHHTQPVLGYPYESVAAPPNLTTSIEWLQKWQNPPRLLQRLAAGPVLPPAATPTVANTITGIAWLHGFQRVKPQRPVYTQPVLGRSDAARLDVAWLRGFDRPVAARQVRPTQPPFVYSPPAVVSNLTTTLEWQQPLSVAVKSPPVRPTQPSLYLPEVVVTAEVSAGESFTITSAYPVRRTLFYQANIWSYAPPPEFVDNTTTIDKWQQPLSSVLYRQVPRPTQPFYGYPYIQEVVPPIEPVPPEIIKPQHSHGQISVPGGRTRFGVLTGTCTPAFQSSFQASGFQTCEGSPATVSRGGVRTSMRIHTSSRWKRARTTIRTGTRCVPAFDEAYQEDAFETCSDTPAAKGTTTTKDDP